LEFVWWDKKELEVEVVARKGKSIETVRRDVEVTAVPAMHWTCRSPLDVNRSLWCSYIIKVKSSEKGEEVKKRSFFFCCDSGYTPLTFSSIGRALGPVDVAALPIGSYEPRWFMRIQHGSPHDALKIAADVGAKQSFATHWGTWCMSDERWDAPLEDLQASLQKSNIPKDYLKTVPFGKTTRIE
jgi:N-acyl-phosphatidylethanolamine-hydrolysing phospholipase D